jgi:hypothetical protein|tara:strand:+ start:72 stop:308 length:237 start_codon:yes stop_codon:yes gene_type:complete
MNMNAETIIKKNTRFDRRGSPLEVVIPYDQFIDFIEEHGLDLTEDEKQSIKQSQADWAAGKRDQFISSEEIKKEFGIS